MLASADYFAISGDEIGRAMSTVIISAQILPLLLAPITTYLYEILGRRTTLTCVVIIITIPSFFQPIIAPHFYILFALRALIGMGNFLIHGAPLVADYVKKESRGLYFSFSILVYMLSQGFSTFFMVPKTIDMTYTGSFVLLSLLYAFASLPFLFMVREPTFKRKLKES